MLRIALLTLLLLPTLALAQGPVYFSARTIQTAKREVVQSTGNVRQTQTVRSLGVEVEYHSYRPPKAPYEVQCFFVARDEATKDRFIYYCKTADVRGGNGKLEFHAQSLKGTTKTVTTIPLAAASDSGETYLGLATSVSEIPGFKMEGWIVRILSEGKVVQIDSNQPHLRTLARENPEWLDASLLQP